MKGFSKLTQPLSLLKTEKIVTKKLLSVPNAYMPICQRPVTLCMRTREPMRILAVNSETFEVITGLRDQVRVSPPV